MAKQNRGTLKQFFSSGSLPSADHFGDLIDSTLNLINEGFDKTAQDGFKISLIGDHRRLISFYRSGDHENPVWTIEYDQENERLLINNPRLDGEPAITLDAHGRVGVARSEPRTTLDVGGVISAEGRLGANPDGFTTVPADGEWHDVTGELEGCQAFEVMAGAGSKGTGRYALMHAVALNAYNPRGWLFNFLDRKTRIRYQQSYFLSRGNRIRLRWRNGEQGRYALQMSTACGYGDGVGIRFYLTRLWDDPAMDAAQQAGEAKP